MREHSAFPRMDRFVNAAVCIESVLRGRENGVELGFLDIRFMAIDGL